MEDFELRLSEVYSALSRYVKVRVDSNDVEDLIQEICLTAYSKYNQLNDKNAFKYWILKIAKNQCNNYLKRNSRYKFISIEEMNQLQSDDGFSEQTIQNIVSDTIEKLTQQDKEVLNLFYWQELSQVDIAKKLGIPLGTVKSRLYNAKNRFKNCYPYPPTKKGVFSMTRLPDYMPDYTIVKMDEAPFSCRWEELQGYFIVPRVGERLNWGIYDFPSKKLTTYTEMEVVGRASIHDITGVEIMVAQYDGEENIQTGCVDKEEHRIIAQLTDAYCRYLAESYLEDGMRKMYTFLDDDEFIQHWGFGKDNCGKEVNIAPAGLLSRHGNVITGDLSEEVMDIVGRYHITLNGKIFDTVCVMDILTVDEGVAIEQFIDQNGRTVLWRRFNKDDWSVERYGGEPWSKKYPDNEQLSINGETYVHWYDCLSTYIY